MFLRTILLFCLLASVTSLEAQIQGWIPVPVAQGDYVKNEFILRTSSPTTANVIKGIFPSYYGAEVTVHAINIAGTDFLVRLEPAYQANSQGECFRLPSAKYPLPCTVCKIVGNPGGEPPVGTVDLLPNSIVNVELAHNNTSVAGSFTDTPPISTGTQEDDLYGIFDNGNFDPFYECGSGPQIPFLTTSGAKGEKLGQVKIAIIDSGINTTRYGNFFNYGTSSSIVQWNDATLTDDFPSTSSVNVDASGHGTTVGYLAAYDFVNKGLQDNIRLISYQVLDENNRGTLANALFAVDQAINNGVDIISLSFGFTGSSCEQGTETIFDEYFANAEEKDILVFVSAGNAGHNLNLNPQYPANNTGLSNVYTIGAEVCRTRGLWDNTNVSQSLVDRTAPGADLLAPYLNSDVDPDEPHGGYRLASGTSFSTPLVAGLAANFILFGSYSEAKCQLETDRIPGGPIPQQSSTSRKGSIFNIETAYCHPIQTEFSAEATTDPVSVNPTIAAFPNPFSNSLTFTTGVSDQSSAVISLIDNQGSSVRTVTSSQPSVTFDTSGLPEGVYFLRIINENGSSTQKIVRQ